VEKEAVSVHQKIRFCGKGSDLCVTKKSGFVENEAVSVSPNNQVLWKKKRSMCHQKIRFCGKRSGLCVTKKSGFVAQIERFSAPQN